MTPLEFAKAKLKSHKACLFTRRGHLLWRSPAWNPDGRAFTAAENARVAGTGWHEFIDAEDLPSVRHWLADADCQRCVIFRCMHSSAGTTHRLLWRKAELDAGHWIVLSADITELERERDVKSRAACGMTRWRW